MELKFGENFKMYMEKEGSNRTFMELKFRLCLYLQVGSSGF